jgi:NADPH:quinone reductase-like Zn-dependent oxidoreductase
MGLLESDGTRVAFFGVRGSWSEYVTAPVRLLAALPDDL